MRWRGGAEPQRTFEERRITVSEVVPIHTVGVAKLQEAPPGGPLRASCPRRSHGARSCSAIPTIGRSGSPDHAKSRRHREERGENAPARRRRVLVDLEPCFDGCKFDEECRRACGQAAAEGGADVLVMCDHQRRGAAPSPGPGIGTELGPGLGRARGMISSVNLAPRPPRRLVDARTRAQCPGMVGRLLS